MFYIRTIPAASLLLCLAFGWAKADNIAATVTTPGGANGTVFSTQGWSFTPQVNVLVSQLGVYDVNADGLGQAHEVGIWTTGGTLLVSATVPAATAATLNAGTRFVNVTATPLSAGQTYIIGAYYLDSTDNLLVDGSNGNVFAYDALIAQGDSRYGLNQFSGLAFPGTATANPPRLGPNFAFTLPAPVTRTWPTDPAPCNNINDLSACLNGANHGDTIEIAANAIPAQDVSPAMAKSFTLRPADGFAPVFAEFTPIFVPGGAIDVQVVIEGLTLARGSIQAGGGSGLLDITELNNVLRQISSYVGLEVFNRTGPTVFHLDNNQINVNVGPGETASAISVWGLEGGDNAGRISGNRIVQVGGGQQGAIEIANGGGTVNVDVIGNQISGTGFNEGIFAYEYGTGDFTARIINNTISGQVDTAGAPAAISLNVSGENGSGQFQVLNNTVAYNETGIQFTGRTDLGSVATALMANNIVAFNSGAGMNFGDFPDTTFNEFNLVYGNGSDEYTPGPGTLTVDPLFIDTFDLHVVGGSPAQDSGSNSRVPADITTDADGNTRVQGIVDRGAFEQSAGGSDQDGDGIVDGLDNCTLKANANQRDTDGDGYGNLCDADLNNTGGNVNLSDFALFRGAFGTANANADLDGNGIVNLTDLALFRALFGNVAGPSGLHP